MGREEVREGMAAFEACLGRYIIKYCEDIARPYQSSFCFFPILVLKIPTDFMPDISGPLPHYLPHSPVVREVAPTLSYLTHTPRTLTLPNLPSSHGCALHQASVFRRLALRCDALHLPKCDSYHLPYLPKVRNPKLVRYLGM